MIRYYEDLLGPYPYEVYGSIVMPFRLVESWLRQHPTPEWVGTNIEWGRSGLE